MLTSIFLKRLKFTDVQVKSNMHMDASRLCSFAFAVSKVLNEETPSILYESCFVFMNTFRLSYEFRLDCIAESRTTS